MLGQESGPRQGVPSAGVTRARPPRPALLLVANPRATATSSRLAAEVARELAVAWTVELVETEAGGHATALTRDGVGRGCDAVAALGGDGTANEVINGLAGSDVPFACFAGGATNVLCRMLGSGGPPARAARRLAELPRGRRRRRIDLGELNGRRFAASAGVGVDASVARWAAQRRRPCAPLRHWHYTYGALRTFLRSYVAEPPAMELRSGGRRLPGVSAFVQNGPHYTFFGARPIDLVTGGSFDDGALAGAVLRRAEAVDVPGIVTRALCPGARVGAHRHVDVFAGARHATLVSTDGRKLPLAVDGDFVTEAAAVRLSVLPRALALVA